MNTAKPSSLVRATRPARASVAALLALALVILASLVPTAAWAAPGDFTIDLHAPESASVRWAFSYDVSVSVEANADAPAAGIVLKATLPEGIAFDTVPTGDASPIASFAYDRATRTVEFTLKDLTEPLVAFSFAVTQDANDSKVENQLVEATLEATAGPTALPEAQHASTTITGDNRYQPTESFEPLVGSGNRVVTYYFDAKPVSPYGSTFTSWAQRLTDVLPAGAVVTGQSTGLGAWTMNQNPDGTTTAVWEKEGRLGPPDLGMAVPARQVWLTVQYPQASFPDGTTPPANVVGLETRDFAGTWHTQPTASVQPPEVQPAGGASVNVVKGKEAGLDETSLKHGVYLSSFETAASYIANGDPNLQSLTLTDDASHSPENAAVFDHFDVYRLAVRFNGTLKSQALPYTLEYTASDQPGVWRSYAPPAATTATDLRIVVQTIGSQLFEVDGYTVGIELPVGAHMTGWRVVVSPDGATSVADGSEVRVSTQGSASIPSLTGGAQVSAPLVNTSVVDAVTSTGDPISEEDPLQITLVDNVPILTQITGPSSVQVGGTGSYVATISNLDPAGRDYIDSVMRVVLPAGVFYDVDKGVSPRSAATVISGIPLPTVGNGMTVTTSSIEVDGVTQQVVEMRFEHLPSIRTAGTLRAGSHVGDGFRYNVPVTVQPAAYSPSGTRVTSWATTDDPQFSAVPMDFTPMMYGLDDYDFSAPLNRIAKSSTTTVFTSAGGLLIGKLVRPDASTPWTPSAAVGTPGTADWQIYARNILPNPVENLVLFDQLPTLSDSRSSTFPVTASGPVTGAPAGSVVEYSTDATSATSGTWTTDPTGATAVRVSIATVATGEEITLEIPTTVPEGLTADDIAINDVTATGDYQGSPRVFSSNRATVTPAATPALDVVKTTNGVEYDSAPGAQVAEGSQVEWTYTVTNTGNTILDTVSVTDTYTAGDGSTGQIEPTTEVSGPLAPGQSRTFVANGEAVPGQYENTATATAVAVDQDGDPLAEQPAEAVDSSWYFGGRSGLSVTKLTQDQDVTSAPGLALEPGSDVTWTYVVENTGTTDLTDVLVVDVSADGTTVFEETVPVLAAGQSVELSAAGTATEGQYENTVTATVTDPVVAGGELQAADTSWYFGAVGAIGVDKRVSDTETGGFVEDVAVTTGQSAWWELVVTNTGNSDLTDVTVTDPQLDEVREVGALPAGESRTFLIQEDKLTVAYTNTVTASGRTALGGQVEDSDDARVTVEDGPVDGGEIAVPPDGGGEVDVPTDSTSTPSTPSAPATPAEPAESEEPGTGLASTGVAVGSVLTLAVLLALGGLVAVRVARRRGRTQE